MTSREDIHRPVDVLPATRLPAVGQLPRAGLADTDPTERRRFASTGTLSAFSIEGLPLGCPAGSTAPRPG